ncbi:uncharacterized protein DS421_7g205670 [Arachis hypogaea]|nr:uncharacterized protein DS421_7g205670 [Arachis hypogaea]
MRKSVAFSQSLKDNASTLQRFNASTLQRFNASLLLSQRQSATVVTCEVAEGSGVDNWVVSAVRRKWRLEERGGSGGWRNEEKWSCGGTRRKCEV